MLIDLHGHSSGISRCCQIPAPEVLKAAKDAGLDGIVLSNHYQKVYIPDGDYAAFAERYLEEYRYAERCAKELGCKVFFGIEVTMEKHDLAHLLVYGVDEEFVREHPGLFEYTQEELYRLVKEAGGALVQAHPFRGRDGLLDVRYLDGIEASCHPLYEGTFLDRVTEVAHNAGIILTCGGDYHADTYRPHCGAYLPDSVESGKDLAKFLCQTDEIKLCVHEVGDQESKDVTFYRPKG